jgi:DNA-directed RNA polymerase subunit RPC12/RpoP
VISVATAIQCARCGFTYGFTDEEIRYTGFVCPSCNTTAPRVEVEADLPGPQSTVDYLLRSATAGMQPVEPERVPALIDVLDVRLALWIAQSTVGEDAA